MTLHIHCGDARQLGAALRRWRALRRIKQDHAGALLGVSQATVSRWENGRQAPDPDEQTRLRTLMQARLDSAADRELARLVEHSQRPVHLVCDLTHRLLALSPARQRQCRLPRAELLGRSLWRYASAEIIEAESRLAALDWFGPAAPALEIRTGANDDRAAVSIEPSRCRWVRFQLADGSFARLVETLDGYTSESSHGTN
ncbi:helix-turn-helix transcriptional regulator [Aquincola sp. S2]|uniref:Helix-turn-helix transcriptional regulator n=1 Tax=Pseudaquabacterium terrae TaxID=2732868 RepID=A0ABX2ENA6_9BURK|nr:helix-turn-helix transcriptional regulator [Aquabacterium terrae]NRF70103.1 helix-turn-helix transcriptional regulator [Aquabacterium terrae]